MRNSSRQKRPFLRVLIPIVFLAVGIGGYEAWQNSNTKHTKTTEIEAKYISFSGNYIFSIPSGRSVDGVSIPSVALVYAGDSVQAKNFEELYAAGVVAVQPITALKDDNPKTFKDYVNNTLAADLRKALNSATDVREVKKENPEAFKVFASTNEGKRLRAIYALNLPQPVMMAAKDETDTLKIVGSTMEDLKKSKLKADIDQAALSTKSLVEMMQKLDSSGIMREGSSEFSKSVSQDKLATDLKSSSSYLSRSITIVGGSYNGKDFIAQLIFEPKTKDENPASGVVSMRKSGKAWKLQAIQLPTP